MPQLQVTAEPQALARARALLSGIRGALPKALASAVNDTTKKALVEMSKAIRAKVNIKKHDIDPYLKRTMAHEGSPTGALILDKSKRINLRYFGARQTKAGVTYQIQKGGARKSIAHAFAQPIGKLRSVVAIRKSGVNKKGKPTKSGLVPKAPLRILRGPSPWGVFVKNELLAPTAEETKAELLKNLKRRTKLALLRQAGVVP